MKKFKLSKFKETAFTPELGGMFEGLQLEIEYFNQEKANNLIYDTLDAGNNSPSKNARAFDQSVKDSVVGWRGVVDSEGKDVEFNEENKKLLLSNHFNENTGIELPDNDPGEETRFYKLSRYIAKFRGDKENFLAG